MDLTYKVMIKDPASQQAGVTADSLLSISDDIAAWCSGNLTGNAWCFYAGGGEMEQRDGILTVVLYPYMLFTTAADATAFKLVWG